MNNLADERFGVHSLDLMPDALQVLEDATADFPEDLRVGREAAALDWLETRGHERRESLQNADEASMLALDAIVSGSVDHAVVVIRSSDVSAEVPPTPPDYLNPACNALYDPDLRRGVLLGAVGLSGYGFTTQQGGVIHNNMLLAKSAIGKPDNASTFGGSVYTPKIFFSRTVMTAA